MNETIIEFEVTYKENCISGNMNINEADDEKPLNFYEYNNEEQKQFPHNPYDTDSEEWVDYELLKETISTNPLFIQYLVDFAEENKSIVLDTRTDDNIILNINEGAKMECEIKETYDFKGDYVVEIVPVFNGEKIDLVQYMGEMNEIFDPWDTNGFCEIENRCIYFEISKDYYDADLKEDVLNDINEEARRIFARALTRELGIYSKYGEVMEQALDDHYENGWLFKLSQMVDKSDKELDAFLRYEGYIDDEL